MRGVACKFRTPFPNTRLRKEDGRKGEGVRGEASGGGRIKEGFCLLSKMGETLSWEVS